MAALRRPGWLTFAAVVLIAFGVLRVITAISYFADSTRVNDLRHGILADHLFLWGLWDLVIAILAIWGGWSLLSGGTFGRVIGYAWAALVLIQSFLIIPWAPWYGVAALTLSMLVLYALTVSSEWRADSTARA